jgi:hypothetical protein
VLREGVYVNIVRSASSLRVFVWFDQPLKSGLGRSPKVKGVQ